MTVQRHTIRDRPRDRFDRQRQIDRPRRGNGGVTRLIQIGHGVVCSHK